MLPIGPLERKRLCITREEEPLVYKREIPLWPVLAQRERFRPALYANQQDAIVRFWQVQDAVLAKTDHSLLDRNDVSSELLEWYGFRWDKDREKHIHDPSGRVYVPGVPLRQQEIPGLWDVEAFSIHYVMSAAIRDRIWREQRRNRTTPFKYVGGGPRRSVLCNGRFHIRGSVVKDEFQAAFHYPCVRAEHVSGAGWQGLEFCAKTAALTQRLSGRIADGNPGPEYGMGPYFAPEYFGFYGKKAFTRERMIMAARIIELNGRALR